MTTRPLRKLLVANRGEIARRVLRTAHAMGIATVAVHGDDDARNPHVAEADEAVWLGAEADGSPYLLADRIIKHALTLGCDAVHPGYGFLAERADFAEAVSAAGLIWVGPPPNVMRAMAEKDAAKQRAQAAGVPVLEGFACGDLAASAIRSKAEDMGFPLLIKAVAGGGGRGMRVVQDSDELVAQLPVAAAEAQKSFGDARLLVERYVGRGRHIEVQIFGDEHGSLVHLHERECSIQRRHQKIIEESPAPTISDALRDEICAAAVRLGASIGYVNAGTVEFLVDEDRGDFAFLEVNARIQVEHPVTEARTGVDLVRWQLRVAQGHPLPLRQDQITATGHAIEARVCAENAFDDHRPQAGDFLLWKPGVGARVDSAFSENQPATVSMHYDSMVAKVIAHAPTREEATMALDRALGTSVALGLVTNLPFLRAILRHPAFISGDTTTGFLTEHAIAQPDAAVDDATLAAAAVWLAGDGPEKRFRNNPNRPDVTVLQIGEARLHVGLHHTGGNRIEACVDRDPDAALFELAPLALKLVVERRGDTDLVLRCDGIARRYTVAQGEQRLWIQPHLGLPAALQVGSLLPEPVAEEAPAGSVVTDSAAIVTEIHVKVGQVVAADDPLVTVEAMKMLAVLRAPHDGTVEQVFASTGQSVAAGQVLVALV